MMETSQYIDMHTLTEEAQNELKKFYDYLVYKYMGEKVKKTEKKFEAIQIDTRGYKFNREEANVR